jgi:hypothetical protein
MVITATTEVDPGRFPHLAVLVTRPGEAPVFQWIVDTALHGPELAIFHRVTLGGAGTLVEHPPAKGLPHGYTQIRVPVAELPAGVVEELPRRLRAAIARQAIAIQHAR